MLLLELLSGFLLELVEAGGNSPSDVRGFISGCFHFYTVLLWAFKAFPLQSRSVWNCFIPFCSDLQQIKVPALLQIARTCCSLIPGITGGLCQWIFSSLEHEPWAEQVPINKGEEVLRISHEGAAGDAGPRSPCVIKRVELHLLAPIQGAGAV